jgi:hypothetical protein
MRNNVYLLYPFRGIELATPPGTSPRDRFKPIHISDNSLHKICIRAEDILYAQLNRKPADGRFSYVEDARGIWLGFVFGRPFGRIKLEPLCHAPCCPPLYFRSPAMVAPISHILRHCGGVTTCFVFDKRREELWKKT